VGIIGSVFQNPRSQFFNLDTDSEVAFACENMGLPKDLIRERVQKTINDFQIENLMGRAIFALSDGEKQKIACASVEAADPAIYVLDEPSSNLDEPSTVNLRLLLERWKEQGKTIIISEHRLQYLIGLADRILYLQEGRITKMFSGKDFFALSDTILSGLGLRSLSVPSVSELTDRILPAQSSLKEKTGRKNRDIIIRDFLIKNKTPNLIRQYRLNIEGLSLLTGTAIALVGNNGVGKTTFARCLCGLEKQKRETVNWDDKSVSTKDRLKKCYMVMQDVNRQLFTESVLDEILFSMKTEDPAYAEDILSSFNLLEYKDRHPQSLSGGQKQRLAIASAFASERKVIIFDEPTSGLDLTHMRKVADGITRLVSQGKTILVITHDMELILSVCSYGIYFEEGRVKKIFTLKGVTTGHD
jgi:energy-coupling factor transport system ATP-binding protein